MKNLTFITGGARSGKSRLAMDLAGKTGKSVCFLATMMARPDDPEQNLRIANHKRSRPDSWHTVECGTNPNEAITNLDSRWQCVILDCLSLFVSGLLMDLPEEDPAGAEFLARARTNDLMEAVKLRTDLDVIIVSNEVGCGVVPESYLGRAFRDGLGTANQIAAASAGTVYFCVSGIPLLLRKDGEATTFSG